MEGETVERQELVGSRQIGKRACLVEAGTWGVNIGKLVGLIDEGKGQKKVVWCDWTLPWSPTHCFYNSKIVIHIFCTC